MFTPSAGDEHQSIERDDGVVEVLPAAEVAHDYASGYATAAAGRLVELERGGHVRIARTASDLDAARADDGPPAAVLHLEGAEAIDPGLESLGLWYEAGLRSLGPVWSRPNAFAHGVPFISPSSPDTGPGLTDAGRALASGCAELGIAVDVSHLNEAGFWDLARHGARPDRGVALRRARPVPDLPQPHRRPARRDRATPAAWSGSCSRARSCGATSPTIRTRRSS